MEIATQNILTPKMVEELHSAINEKENEKLRIQHEINEYKQKLVANAIEGVKERLCKDLEFGDKVKVNIEHTSWDGKPIKKTEIGFLHSLAMSKYWTTYNQIDINNVKVAFAQVKKDGTPSLRIFDYYQNDIVSIEKID